MNFLYKLFFSNGGNRMLDKLLKITVLYDFYGALLTDKQQSCLEMHFLQDFSLSESADQLGVSRQAIYDISHRSEQVLLEYEQKLKLIERYHSEKNELKNILDIMSDLPKNVQDIPEFQDVLIKLSHLIGDSKEA